MQKAAQKRITKSFHDFHQTYEVTPPPPSTSCVHACCHEESLSPSCLMDLFWPQNHLRHWLPGRLRQRH